MKVTFIKILAITLLIFSASTVSAQDDEYGSQNKMAAKEFVRSCTYGVLAGTLVGAATLAFTEQPGENISRVARGASLGLYSGILLGLYVVYVVPSQIEDSLNEEESELLPLEDGDDYSLKWGAFPLIGQHGVEGAGFNFEITAF